jgi:hypothetical protein
MSPRCRLADGGRERRLDRHVHVARDEARTQVLEKYDRAGIETGCDDLGQTVTGEVCRTDLTVVGVRVVKPALRESAGSGGRSAGSTTAPGILAAGHERDRPFTASIHASRPRGLSPWSHPYGYRPLTVNAVSVTETSAFTSILKSEPECVVMSSGPTEVPISAESMG